MNVFDEKVIRAYQTNSTIRVYQAFSSELADLAIINNSFKNNPFFKTTRMTWIKPSFLWMMYRSNWGMKDQKQERILAIDITKEGFSWALNHSCSTKKPDDISENDWQQLKLNTPVRIQWDPDRNILLEPQKYRAIQVGLSGIAVEKYINNWIINITDITPDVQKIYRLILDKKIGEAKKNLPKESIYINL